MGLSAGLAAWSLRPREGLWNKCLQLPLPAHLVQHEIVHGGLADLNATNVWNMHVHLTWLGVGKCRVWINPLMRNILHPCRR